MASTTANLQKIKQAVTELENISVSMVTTHSKLNDIMGELTSKWHGEAANRYIEEFKTHSPDLEKMAAVIDTAASSLQGVNDSYARAESEASDVVSSLLGKR